jgi:multiple sugar transport system permease protein
MKMAKVKNQTSKIVTMVERDMDQVKKRQKTMKILSRILVYLFLGVMAIIVLFPFYWMIISSLKSLEEYKLAIPTLFPQVIHWDNYIRAFNTANLWQLFKNTMYVGVVSTILSLVITVLSAFAFARLEFKGRDTFFTMLLATMMIPGELFTITNYQTVSNFLGLATLGKQLGIPLLVKLGMWHNTYAVLIVPFLVSVFYIYLLKQNFLQIPNELYLAAKVDGTTDLKYLWKVMIPLAFPTLISITILKMMGAWNSYVWPRLVANREDMRMITNGLRNAFTNANTLETDYPVQMAAVALVSIPLFLVFLFFRKYIMKGVSRSGIKG